MENNSNINVQEKDESQFVPLMQFCWAKFKHNWGWFVLSVAICATLGIIYLKKQAPLYQRQAVMLIEDANTSSPMGGTSKKARGAMSSLMELNGISVGDNLKNEMFILTSRRLMERVVDTLRLDVDYTIPQSLHEYTLYSDRPFEVVFAERADVAANFKVRVNDNGTFTLHDFNVYAPGVEDSRVAGEVTLKPRENKNTPAGELRLETNEALRDFPVDKEVTVKHLPRKMAAAVYSGKISASEYDKESSLIVLTCQDVNAKRAEDVLVEVYEAYKRDVVENKNRVATSTERFIDERIRLIGEDLDLIESRLAQFKRDNNLVDFQQNAQVALAESAEARKQTIELETQVAVARYLTDFLQDKSKMNEPVPMLSLPQATFVSLITEYNKVMIERNRMLGNSSEESPVIRDLERELSSLRTSLISSISSYVSSVELQLQRARNTEAVLGGKMGGVPDTEKEGLDIKRQQELKSSLYTYLLNKREEVSLQKAINEANVRLVEEPLGSPSPVSPRSTIIIAISVLLGILIPSGFIWLKHLLDVTVSGRKDVTAMTAIPIVGDLPHWDDCKSSVNGLITNVSTDAPIVEAFRMLRYGLNFMRHSAKVFIFTSATQGQGKSFISSNMSCILGATGKRILYIDADLRKRTSSTTFGNTKFGLTALLADELNELSLSDVVVTDGIAPGVDFLPAGKMPPNPSELLMSDKLDEIVDAARAAYDYVVIDTTPTMAVADAGVVNRVADITVFVVRVGVQERAFLTELDAMYKAKKFRNLCIVINDADTKSGYGGGYGYGYGYSHESEKKKKFFSWRR